MLLVSPGECIVLLVEVVVDYQVLRVFGKLPAGRLHSGQVCPFQSVLLLILSLFFLLFVFLVVFLLGLLRLPRLLGLFGLLCPF